MSVNVVRSVVVALVVADIVNCTFPCVLVVVGPTKLVVVVVTTVVVGVATVAVPLKVDVIVTAAARASPTPETLEPLPVPPTSTNVPTRSADKATLARCLANLTSVPRLPRPLPRPGRSQSKTSCQTLHR